MMHYTITSPRRAQAKRMRSDMTPAELKFWNAVRAHRLMNFGFRRQLPIAGFVADFACPEHRMIIEIDGSQHARDQNMRRDAARSRRLEDIGWTIVRFWNDDVLKDIDGVCGRILATIAQNRNGDTG